MRILSNIALVGGLLVAASTISPVIFADEAHAYACKGTQYSAASTKHVKGIAKVSARNKWQNSMKSQFGYTWGVWSIAAGKSIQCHKTGSKHTCHALARPCQYVAG